MSEKINIDFKDLSFMASEALDFFNEEVRQGNNVVVNKAGKALEFSSIRDWDKFLIDSGIVKTEIKKDIRI